MPRHHQHGDATNHAACHLFSDNGNVNVLGNVGVQLDH